MIESILVGTFVFLTFLFLSLYLVQIKNNRAILANTLKLLIMQESLNSENKTDKEQADEAFLKFISDSRDWAYSYIEETQEKIDSFINDAGSVIDYLEAYAPPILPDEQRLSLIKGYKNIKTILPEDYGKLDT